MREGFEERYLDGSVLDSSVLLTKFSKPSGEFLSWLSPEFHVTQKQVCLCISALLTYWAWPLSSVSSAENALINVKHFSWGWRSIMFSAAWGLHSDNCCGGYIQYHLLIHFSHEILNYERRTFRMIYSLCFHILGVIPLLLDRIIYEKTLKSSREKELK